MTRRHEKVFVASYEVVGLRGGRLSKQVVVARIPTQLQVGARLKEKPRLSVELTKQRRIGGRDTPANSRPIEHVGQFGQKVFRTDQFKPPASRRICDRRPPAADQGADRRRRIQYRSYSGFSDRTSSTIRSISWSSKGSARPARSRVRSSTPCIRSRQVIRSTSSASAARSWGARRWIICRIESTASRFITTIISAGEDRSNGQGFGQANHRPPRTRWSMARVPYLR